MDERKHINFTDDLFSDGNSSNEEQMVDDLLSHPLGAGNVASGVEDDSRNNGTKIGESCVQLNSQQFDNLLKKFKLSKITSGSAIGNKWFDGDNELNSYCPTNNQLIGKVLMTKESDLSDIIKVAHQAFLKWRTVPAPKRGELVRLIGNRLREYKKELGYLVSLEMGKSLPEGEGEVQEMIDMADFAVGQSRMLYGNAMHSERPEHRMYEQWHPLGVVGVISAFNFPVAVWAWNAFLAVICGNSVIWKPSPKTPFCAIVVHKICAEVLKEYDYPNIFSLITTDSLTLSEKFIDNNLIPLVSFTGSTKVGRIVGERLASRFARSLLELGGNNAVIIDKTADLVTAIPSLVFAAVGTAGQRCTTLRRLIIHEDIYDQVVKTLVHAYRQLKIGNPLDEANHIGPLIDKEAVTRFEQAVTKAQSEGGKVLFGGKKLDNSEGNFVMPTIIEANPNWDIVNEETFAPILYLISYRSFAEAIAINNQVVHGLSSAIFTSNLQTAELFLSAAGSDCGIANVNIGTSGAEIGGAFGGEKATGGGREAGSDAWKAYMRRQTTTINYGSKLSLAQGIKFEI